MKSLVRKILGEERYGALDFWLFPKKRSSWGGPFNGQDARRRLFETLIAEFHPRAIIETGTFRGTTTELMAATGLPIFTIESDRRQYGYSLTRLRNLPNVSVHYGDSRTVMGELFEGPLLGLRQEVLLVYLDAHWSGELPLINELNDVFRYCPAAVVMIDDFQVPFDRGYKYNNYGTGRELALPYIEPAMKAHGLVARYPSTPSSEETGKRCGCVVLANEARHGRMLDSTTLLRPA